MAWQPVSVLTLSIHLPSAGLGFLTSSGVREGKVRAVIILHSFSVSEVQAVLSESVFELFPNSTFETVAQLVGGDLWEAAVSLLPWVLRDWQIGHGY